MNEFHHETRELVTGRYKTTISDIPISYVLSDRSPSQHQRFVKLGKQIEQNQANDPTSLEALQINALHQLVNIPGKDTTHIAISGSWINDGFVDGHDIDIVYLGDSKSQRKQLFENIYTISENARLDPYPMATNDPLVDLKATDTIRTSEASKGISLYVPYPSGTAQAFTLEEVIPSTPKAMDISIPEQLFHITPQEAIIQNATDKPHIRRGETITSVLYTFERGTLVKAELIFSQEMSDPNDGNPSIVLNPARESSQDITTSDLTKLLKDIDHLMLVSPKVVHSPTELVSADVLKFYGGFISTLSDSNCDYTGYTAKDILLPFFASELDIFQANFERSLVARFPQYFSPIQNKEVRLDMSIVSVLTAVRYMQYLKNILTIFRKHSSYTNSANFYRELFFALNIHELSDKILPANQHIAWETIVIDFKDLEDYIESITPQVTTRNIRMGNWQTPNETWTVFFPLAQIIAGINTGIKLPKYEYRKGFFNIADIDNTPLVAIAGKIPQPNNNAHPRRNRHSVGLSPSDLFM